MLFARDTQAARVLIVEDEDLYRDMLKATLTQFAHITIAGAFADGPSALETVEETAPNVAILDIELRGGMNGIQLGLLLRRKLGNIGIVLLSNHQDPALLSAIPREEAAGWSYLSKKALSSIDALEQAVSGAVSGFVVLDPQLAGAIKSQGDRLSNRLTPRQHSVLSLMAAGFSNGAVAERLGLSVKSVKNQINALYQELEIDARDPHSHPRVRAVLAFLRARESEGLVEQAAAVEPGLRPAARRPPRAGRWT